VTSGALFLQSKTDFQRHLPVADFTPHQCFRGFRSLRTSACYEPSFPRVPVHFERLPLESFCRGTDYFNFFVNVIRHGALSGSLQRKTIKRPFKSKRTSTACLIRGFSPPSLAKGEASDAQFANFLYNGSSTQAPSHRGENLLLPGFLATCCSPLRTGAGSGTQTGRPPTQARHESAK